MIVLSGDHPLLDAGFITALAERHAAPGRPRPSPRAMLEDPGQYGRIVRDARRRRRADRRDQDARRRHARGAGDPGGQQPAPTRSRWSRCSRRSGRSGPTTPRARCTSATPCRCCAPPGTRVVAYLTDDESVSLGINTRADLAEVQAQRAAADPRTAHARGRDDHRPRLDLHRRRRPDRRGHDDRALHACCAARPRSARAARSGPVTTLIDCAGRRRQLGRALLSDRVRGAGRLHGRALHPHPARHRLHEGAKAGVVRGDQELRRRRGREGAAPLLHRATPTSARAPTSGRARSPPTTTAAPSTAP